jgi:hypothetical protein
LQQARTVLLLKKLRVLLVLPAALFIGAIGWSLMWIDSQKSPNKNVKTDFRDRDSSDLVSLELAREPVDSDPDGVPQSQEMTTVATG